LAGGHSPYGDVKRLGQTLSLKDVLVAKKHRSQNIKTRVFRVFGTVQQMSWSLSARPHRAQHFVGVGVFMVLGVADLTAGIDCQQSGVGGSSDFARRVGLGLQYQTTFGLCKNKDISANLSISRRKRNCLLPTSVGLGFRSSKLLRRLI
jgi:hypothetical protein